MDRLQELQKKLDLTEQEAKELVEYDRAVDRNQKTKYDLTTAQEKVAKKMRNPGRAKKQPTVYQFKPKPKKIDLAKENIIKAIESALEELGAKSIEITNPSKQIDFAIGEDKYYFSLVRKRKSKQKD